MHISILKAVFWNATSFVDSLIYKLVCRSLKPVSTGLPIKGSSETIVRNLLSSFNLYSRFLVGHNWFISLLYQLVNHQHTQLNAESKNQTSNCHIFRVLGSLYTLILCG